MMLVIALLFASADFSIAKRKEKFKTHEVVPEKELLITDPAVVDSRYAIYPGPFSFGHLIDELAGDGDVSDFMRKWLETWETDQSINKHTVAARKDFAKLITDPWQAKDGFGGKPRVDWEVDLANAPFRLLAIVNRIDLGGVVQINEDGNPTFADGSFGPTATPEYYGTDSTTGGEFRLIYGATDQDGEPIAGGFTVIFEYSLPDLITTQSSAPDLVAAAIAGVPVPSAAERTLEGRLEVANYAKRWHALGEFEDFDQDYLQHLSKLAIECTDRPLLDPEIAPALAQLRTNEGAFGEIQEAREFSYANNYLVPATVAATPDVSFTRDPEKVRSLTKYINDNSDVILTSLHSVPVNVRGSKDNPREQVPFRAGSALMPKLDDSDKASSFFWEAKRVRDPDALRIFSLNTCSGCHCGETDTEFYHIKPRREGEASELSKFLRMDSSKFVIKPPNGRSNKIEYNEMAQRTVIFESLLDPYLNERQLRRLLRKRTRTSH